VIVTSTSVAASEAALESDETLTVSGPAAAAENDESAGRDDDDRDDRDDRDDD
jgi:hypothetical protein